MDFCKELKIDKYKFGNLGRINIILGKNGCGKSTVLRGVADISNRSAQYMKSYNIHYITPERAGFLAYSTGIEDAVSKDHNNFSKDRRKNQHPNFKQQSAAQYQILRDIIRDEVMDNKDGLRLKLDYTFDVFTNKLNLLLDQIEIQNKTKGFSCHNKGGGNEIKVETISSGESELIALGVEALIFAKQCKKEMSNFFLLDEPDVHMHPDLQARFMQFLNEVAAEYDFQVIIATHSTAILGSLPKDDLGVLFMQRNAYEEQTEFEFSKVNSMYHDILPIFGAHPLSNMFNKAPIFLVEGEDDVRIWQQVVRSSNRIINVYPCATGSIDKIHEYEQLVERLASTIYDEPKAYSLRDGDDKVGEQLDHMTVVKRMRLNCKAAENLLVTDEVLSSVEMTWDKLQEKIEKWLDSNQEHGHYNYMSGFKDSGFDRRNYDLKDIRNIITGLIHPSKPWEVLVGQTIASYLISKSVQNKNATMDDSLENYLGVDLMRVLSQLMTN